MTTTDYTCYHCSQSLTEDEAVIDGLDLSDPLYHLDCYFAASKAAGQPVWCGACNAPITRSQVAKVEQGIVVHAGKCPTDA